MKELCYIFEVLTWKIIEFPLVAERLVKEEVHNNVAVVPLWTDVLIVSADV